jgi:hypothetical protein
LNAVFPFLADPPDPVGVPRSRDAVWIERWLWVFIFSFALDYRSTMDRQGGGGTGIDQLLFLGLCFTSFMAIAWIGRRFLLAGPGAWLIAFWSLFLVYMLGNSVLQGVMPGRSLRVALPLFFCLFGMVASHVAGCAGIRPAAIVRPLLIAACVNILWRIINGFLFQSATIETVRFEVQSPANSWLAAWIGCSILLRSRFHWSSIVACGVLFIGIFITVTRSLFFPVITSAIATGLCFLLAVSWKQYAWTVAGRRLLPVGVIVAFVIMALGLAAMVEPLMIERWNERLFHNASAQNLSADISYLTRRAEAEAIVEILDKNPIQYLNGKGVGCTYYWHPKYLPEIWMVLPKKDTEVNDIWFAGHSVWTYGLLSGGVIALVCYLVLFVWTVMLGFIAARANASEPGPDQWLAFLPIVATCCLLSETLTANPFQERLTGILFGIMAGLPQAFMVRASWIHTRISSHAVH